ncbi:hypothetical protein BBP40_005864 [Aspergillus hancockii]|nr:hypothetical protein BBP40_005864 [Aspergillus hancockii]
MDSHPHFSYPTSHLPKRPYTRSETPEQDATPASKRQSTEAITYSDLLHLYEKIKQDVSTKYSLPEREETPAPWVVDVLKMLDDAEKMDECHRKAVESVEKDIICLAAILEKMRGCDPVRMAVCSAELLMTVHAHDIEGKKILERRIEEFERSLDGE